jgi:putative addiction module CopG family antidote
MDKMERPDERDGMDVHLPPELSDFVDEEVRRGEYSSSVEVVREAVRRLAEDRRAREELDRQIEAGWAESEAGELLDPDEVFARVRARIDAQRQSGR